MASTWSVEGAIVILGVLEGWKGGWIREVWGMKRRLVSALGGLLAVLVPGVGLAAQPAAGATGTGWQPLAKFPARPTADAVACPSASVCYAVGDEILGTSDGGQSWHPQSPPAGLNNLWGIACPSVSTCFAAGVANGGAGMVATVNSGRSWFFQSVPSASSLSSLRGVACSSVADCVAVGGQQAAAVTTSDGGATWTLANLPTGVDALYGVSCPTSTLCLAVGDSVVGANLATAVVRSTDSGSTWALENAPAGADVLSAVTCFDSSNCVTVGYNKDLSSGEITSGGSATTTDGGLTWTPDTTDSLPPLYSVDCPSASGCFTAGSSTNYTSSAVTAALLASANGGSSWDSDGVPGDVQTVTGVGCGSGSSCVGVGTTAAGGLAVVGTGDGATWADQPTPPPVLNFDGISCGSATSCAVVGSGDSATNVPLGRAVTTSDGGITWTAGQVPSSLENLLGVSCPSATTCFAVGQLSVYSDAVVESGDGGLTWSTLATTPFDSSGPLYNGITCTSAQTCLAYGTGGNILKTTDGWASWTTNRAPADTVASISCPDSQHCVAVWSSAPNNQPVAATSADGGATWIAATSPPPPNIMPYAVSCPAVDYCVAVGSGSQTEISTDGFNTWTTSPVPTPTGAADLVAVACATTTDCTATGWDSVGAVVLGSTDGGHTWQLQGVPAGSGPLDAVACPSASACEAAGQTQDATTSGLILGPAPTAPVITTTGLSGATAGTPYSASLTATGAQPFRWTVTGLPSGLAPDPTSGAISGVPYQAGTFYLGVTVTDANQAATTAILSLVVGSATPGISVTASPGSSTWGDPVTYTAQLTGYDNVAGLHNPVSFAASGVALCNAQPSLNDVATCTATNAPVGADTVTASYPGDANYRPASASTSLAVGISSSSLHLASSSPAAYADQAVTYTATVSAPTSSAGIPNGTVAFAAAGRPVAACSKQPVNTSAGRATCSIAFTSTGHPSVTATYSGSPHFDASQATIVETVNPSPPCPTGLTHLARGEPWAVAAVTVNRYGRTCAGYWIVTRSGGVTSVGAAPWLGDESGRRLSAPTVGIAATPDHGGYYLLGADGGIFTFGDARFFGSTGAIHLRSPVVAMAVNPEGNGYWLVAGDGGVFTFGRAVYHGSTGREVLAHPIIDLAVDLKTGGYWIVSSGGQVFGFDAPYLGSTAGVRLSAPIVGMTAEAEGGGYRLVGADGGVFDFGHAAYYGSLPARGVLNPDVTTMAASVDDRGYYLINALGRVWGFGDAPYLGNA